MAHESIVTITEDNFAEEVEQSDLPILVDVWGEGCGPCKMIEPLIDQIAAEFEGKRPIARHQLVYRCLGKLVGNEIHALSIKALTPDEWRAAGEGQPLG